MKHHIWPAAMLGSILLFLGSGCGVVLTNVPIYQPSDRLTDPALGGAWVIRGENGQEAVFRFVPTACKRYRIQEVPPPPPSDSAEFKWDLVRIGKYEYLFPAASNDLPGTILSMGCRLRFIGDRLQIAMLSQPAVLEDLQQNPTLLSHEFRPVPGWPAVTLATSQPATIRPTTAPTTAPAAVNIVLTGNAAEIRRQIIRHQDDPRWFVEVLTLRRAGSKR